MKLILEHTDHGFYAYFETERHHRNVNNNPEGREAKTRVPARTLSNDCYLPDVLREGEYMVIQVKHRR